jgi:hypothetical protein
MSPQPNSSARYQSHLLNFLNRQSLRLRDQGHIWLRQLPLTMRWGGQIALYPIYALFQTGRLAARQLRQSFQTGQWSPTDRSSSTTPLPPEAVTVSLPIVDWPQLAAPTRRFYQLMYWVQQGPLAHRLDWFDETALVLEPRPEWPQAHLGRLSSNPLIRLDGVTNFDWQAWANPFPQTSPFTHWLKAAIAYFFGRTTPTLSAAPAPAKIADPWDFTVDEATSIDEFSDNEFATADQPITVPAIEWQLTGRAASPHLPPSTPRPALPSTSQNRSRNAESNLTWANVFANDLTTTLIDTIATPIGYIQHPLERLLGWLDQALLWIETQVQHLWQWLTSRSLKKH